LVGPALNAGSIALARGSTGLEHLTLGQDQAAVIQRLSSHDLEPADRSVHFGRLFRGDRSPGQEQGRHGLGRLIRTAGPRLAECRPRVAGGQVVGCPTSVTVGPVVTNEGRPKAAVDAMPAANDAVVSPSLPAGCTYPMWTACSRA